jgi:hypothetical protein
MAIYQEKEIDTRLLHILSRQVERCAAPLRGGPPPELLSRRIDGRKMVLSHLTIFLEAAEGYLQEYGTSHDFGSKLQQCVDAVRPIRASL